MSMSVQTYEQELEAWRAMQEASWRQENGWLALAGLFWLEEGESRMGTGPDMEIQLPSGKAPAHLATITLKEGKVRLTAPAGSPVYVDGQPVTDIEMMPERPGPATIVTSGSLAFFIKNEDDDFMAVRLWDNDREERQSFPGREWYPIQDAYRVTGRFEPNPHTEEFPRTFGMVAEKETLGTVKFELLGQELALQALPGRPGTLFLIFRDKTSGQSTYAPGRYMLGELGDDNTVTLDFNKAFNPPCSVTNYATCMFPPPSNHLPVVIEAGEKYVDFLH